MPLRCTVRPNRTRVRAFTERDAARIVCRVLNEGGQLAAIERHRIQICGGDGKRPQRAAAEALAAAALALQESNLVFEATLAFFALLMGLLSLLQTLGRTPATFPIKIAARQIIEQVGALQRMVASRVAANERTYQIVQAAAANEAQFALRAGAR